MNHQLKQDKQEISLLISAYVKNFLSHKIKYLNINLFDEIINETIQSNIDNHLSELMLNVHDKILNELQQSLSKEMLLQNKDEEEIDNSQQTTMQKQNDCNDDNDTQDAYDISDITLPDKDDQTFTLSQKAIKKMLK